MSTDLNITPQLTLPAAELSWVAVRSSGPGGQNVNKVATKVELRFDLEGSAQLTESVRARLRAIARNRLDAEGRIVISSQLTRSQERNLEDAREKLAGLVREALTPPRKRRPTKPSRGAKERRLKGKREQADKKRARRRVDGSD
jgi:ribosome-associated protein